MPAPDRITSESADFQLLEALLHNRRKRTQRGEFLIEGVQAINRAVAAGWPIRSVLTPMGTALSSWASGIVAAAPRHVEVRADLFARLTDREELPEALLVGEIVEPALSDLHPRTTAWWWSSTDPRARATSAPSCARAMPSAPLRC